MSEWAADEIEVQLERHPDGLTRAEMREKTGLDEAAIETGLVALRTDGRLVAGPATGSPSEVSFRLLGYGDINDDDGDVEAAAGTTAESLGSGGDGPEFVTETNADALPIVDERPPPHVGVREVVAVVEAAFRAPGEIGCLVWRGEAEWKVHPDGRVEVTPLRVDGFRIER